MLPPSIQAGQSLVDDTGAGPDLTKDLSLQVSKPEKEQDLLDLQK
jgi:hypothetical protein